MAEYQTGLLMQTDDIGMTVSLDVELDTDMDDNAMVEALSTEVRRLADVAIAGVEEGVKAFLEERGMDVQFGEPLVEVSTEVMQS